MANKYYTLVTNIGKAKMANAQVTGQKVEFTQIALGSGKSTPQETATSLVKEEWRGNLSNISIDTDNPNWIVIEGIVPANVGGFTINELGLYDKSGDLLVVGNYPETYKPVGEEGTIKDIAIRVIIEVTNADTVTLKVDPSVVIATRKYVDDAISKAVGDIDTSTLVTKVEFDDHVKVTGSGSASGHVKLSNATDSTSAVADGVAATPMAVKTVYDAKFDKAGGTFTGVVKAQTNTQYNTPQVFNAIAVQKGTNISGFKDNRTLIIVYE